MNIKSRILEFIPKDCMLELDAISRDVLIPDNNTKVDKMIATFLKYDVPFQELGPGTNRLAVFIDGYVFKIALDKDGKRDNLAEFSMSQELQPFVIKVYECNGLIIVTEYVTVISKEEFMNSKDQIRETLSYLSEGYLLGDVGSISKNFVNWGFRDDGSLVILDFAYIYRVLGNEMTCDGLNKDDTICKEMLEYDENFNNLICPRCRKTYTFHEIRRKISKDYENKELNAIKQIAIKVTKPNQNVNVTASVDTSDVEDVTEEVAVDNDYGGNDNMGKKYKKHDGYYDNYNTEDDLDSYLDAMNFMQKKYDNEHHICDCENNHCECFCESVKDERVPVYKVVVDPESDIEDFRKHTNLEKGKSYVCDLEETDEGLVKTVYEATPEEQAMIDELEEELEMFNTEDSKELYKIVTAENPIEEAVENVEEFLEGSNDSDDYDDESDSDDEFVEDPDDEVVKDWTTEEYPLNDDCVQVTNVLGAGIEFIEIGQKELEEKPVTKLEDAGTDVIVLTDSDEKREEMKKLLMASNDFDESEEYSEEYDELYEQTLKDSKIPKKKHFE